MSRTVSVGLFGGMLILLGIAFSYSRTREPELLKLQQSPKHGVFEWLDDLCRHKYGDTYMHSINRCCDQSLPRVCATLPRADMPSDGLQLRNSAVPRRSNS